jgi:hypothetical protein
MSIDGTTLHVSDTRANTRAFGRSASSRGVNATGGFPQLRLVGLLENGTHVIMGAELGGMARARMSWPLPNLPRLTDEMLCERLADGSCRSELRWNAF